jgi:hypothetical protein
MLLTQFLVVSFHFYRRLCPDISFFQQATDYPCKEIVGGPNSDAVRLHNRVEYSALRSASVERRGIGMNKVKTIRLVVSKTDWNIHLIDLQVSFSVKKAQEDYAVLNSGQEAHWEVVERILFIYAKLNPGQSYVQGMNEIIGPIYYLFATDPSSEWRGMASLKLPFMFSC